MIPIFGRHNFEKRLAKRARGPRMETSLCVGKTTLNILASSASAKSTPWMSTPPSNSMATSASPTTSEWLSLKKVSITYSPAKSPSESIRVKIIDTQMLGSSFWKKAVLRAWSSLEQGPKQWTQFVVPKSSSLQELIWLVPRCSGHFGKIANTYWVSMAFRR